jgi:hypothetical protein
MTRFVRVLLITAVVFATGLAVSAPASADLTLNPNLCQGNNVGSCPNNDWPFIIANFDGAGTVTLTMTADLTSDTTQYVSNWWFNLDPSVVPTGSILTITETDTHLSVEKIISGDTANSPSPYVVTIAQNSLPVDGGGQFDLQFNFVQAGNVNTDKFDGSDVLTFTITCTESDGVTPCAGFDFTVFDTTSTGPDTGHTPYIAAPGSPNAGQLFTSPFRTIASINPAGHFIAGVGAPFVTPEPATLLLVGAGLVGIGAMARRKLGR